MSRANALANPAAAYHDRELGTYLKGGVEGGVKGGVKGEGERERCYCQYMESSD